WPAYGDAVARGDIDWIKRTLRRSILLAASGAAALSGACLLLAPTLIYWWVGDAVAPSFALLLGLAIWKVIEVAGNAIAMFLNGANVLKIQALCGVATAVSCVVLRIWWTDLFGLPGLIAATITAYSLFTVPFFG